MSTASAKIYGNNSRVEVDDLHREIARLSLEQRSLIRYSYSFMEAEATRNGLGLFVRLFADFPQYKSIWPQFRQIPDSALISSDQLRNHATVYMAGLKEIVGAMDDTEKLISATRRIAASHCKWSICKFHIEHMVPGLLEVLNICMNRQMTPEISHAWERLYDIIGNMIGLQKGIRRPNM
ncbi:GLOBIN domain-containing protein [Trichostrongylus colubriformis]|uniref:GLOBIN domain-containing protein n=1 Tax=Trichostrongylus colubriformis TaxID=6319 RepID=A0AAN8F3J6_TRICO